MSYPDLDPADLDARDEARWEYLILLDDVRRDEANALGFTPPPPSDVPVNTTDFPADALTDDLPF